jgi:hypothetical protein
LIEHSAADQGTGRNWREIKLAGKNGGKKIGGKKWREKMAGNKWREKIGGKQMAGKKIWRENGGENETLLDIFDGES